MNEEIKEIKETLDLDIPIFVIDDEGFTVYINDKINNYITSLQEENQKLVKVIDELEKWLKEYSEKDTASSIIFGVCLEHLNELKGGDSDE